jgi:hypothetical protein
MQQNPQLFEVKAVTKRRRLKGSWMYYTDWDDGSSSWEPWASFQPEFKAHLQSVHPTWGRITKRKSLDTRMRINSKNRRKQREQKLKQIRLRQSGHASAPVINQRQTAQSAHAPAPVLNQQQRSVHVSGLASQSAHAPAPVLNQQQRSVHLPGLASQSAHAPAPVLNQQQRSVHLPGLASHSAHAPAPVINQQQQSVYVPGPDAAPINKQQSVPSNIPDAALPANKQQGWRIVYQDDEDIVEVRNE